MLQVNTEMPKQIDARTQSDVIAELKWDTRVNPADIGVEVHDGVVTLNGHVDSWAVRVAAQEAAHRVRGVLDVANEIIVKLPGSSRRDDTDLAREVRRALEWDVLVPQDRIQTTVSDGVVTLEGTVDFRSQHEDAARCIRNLAGVRQVNNCVVVEPPAVTLQTLRTAMACALERQAAGIAEHVHIAVIGGTVMLKGRVPTATDRKIVEDAMRETPGVKSVENSLEVQSAAPS